MQESLALVSCPTRWSLYWPLALCIDPPINRETEYSNVLAPSSTLFQSLISIRCPYHWDAHLSTKHIFVFFLLSRVWIHVYFLLMMPITRVDHICETDQMWFDIFWSLCKNPIRWQSNLWLKSIQVHYDSALFQTQPECAHWQLTHQVERMFSILLRDTAGAGFSIKVKLILGFTLFPTIGFLRGRCLALKGVGGPTIGLCARPCIMAF